ncbi:diaminopimelate decarboxylase [Nocardiopsis sp. TSRI0078]|uniref:diaminopimelate decarboxylase n=1 Tax=unclassified Nocardiopsis TaxID=2649073 RepID=UPI000939220D|nr:diaminopimelate decarboxylase [Nocardiopsis sp. TSRI0078]OKI15276.1 diaminopimelate decarboxylase [Nocardiopsis sp. TSRI0078]
MPTTESPGPDHARLAEEFGTPLFVYDAQTAERSYAALRRALPEGVDIMYSLKANPNVSVCALLGSLGAGAEVSSHAELVTALRAGIAPEDVIFLGPGKSHQELEACLDAGIAALVCESLDEVERVDALVGQRGSAPFPVMLRVNPSFAAKGQGLAMGGKPRQFGIDEAVVRDAKHRLGDLAGVRITGIHAYMGTRFLDHTSVVRNTERILGLAESLAADLGIDLESVDFGGGLGVAYFAGEGDPDMAALGRGMHEAIADFRGRNPRCRLMMESGRYLTAASGTYVVRVREVKESMGELFAVADGGTNHHMAAVGVGSFAKRNFPVRRLGPAESSATHEYSVTGPLCTPNDLIAKKVVLPELRAGDLLGIGRSGAYGPTASPGLFLSHGYPAEVMVHRGRAHLVRLPDTTGDLLGRQRLVDLR